MPDSQLPFFAPTAQFNALKIVMTVRSVCGYLSA